MTTEDKGAMAYDELYEGRTGILYRGRPASPYARHNVLGNSWAVPCARWICERLDHAIRGDL